jgi:hypothetical protein
VGLSSQSAYTSFDDVNMTRRAPASRVLVYMSVQVVFGIVDRRVRRSMPPVVDDLAPVHKLLQVEGSRTSPLLAAASERAASKRMGVLVNQSRIHWKMAFLAWCEANLVANVIISSAEGTRLLINWGNRRFLPLGLPPHAKRRNECNTGFVVNIFYRSTP